MNRRTATAALADALGGLVAEKIDVTDMLAGLVADCAAVTGADAVALLVQDVDEELALLTASSHRAAEIEMLQIQGSRGPCLDCIDSGASVHAAGLGELSERWGRVGQGIFEAGFAALEAYPMRWHGVTFGGLNVFHADPAAAAHPEVGQAFADVATLVILQSLAVSREQLLTRLHEAVGAREVVEQAKGVLAYTHDLDLGSAYDELVRLSRLDGRSLTEVARTVLDDARRGPGAG